MHLFYFSYPPFWIWIINKGIRIVTDVCSQEWREYRKNVKADTRIQPSSMIRIITSISLIRLIVTCNRSYALIIRHLIQLYVFQIITKPFLGSKNMGVIANYALTRDSWYKNSLNNLEFISRLRKYSLSELYRIHLTVKSRISIFYCNCRRRILEGRDEWFKEEYVFRSIFFSHVQRRICIFPMDCSSFFFVK